MPPAELRAAHVPAVVAGDNCRDPVYASGEPTFWLVGGNPPSSCVWIITLRMTQPCRASSGADHGHQGRGRWSRTAASLRLFSATPTAWPPQTECYCGQDCGFCHICPPPPRRDEDFATDSPNTGHWSSAAFPSRVPQRGHSCASQHFLGLITTVRTKPPSRVGVRMSRMGPQQNDTICRMSRPRRTIKIMAHRPLIQGLALLPCSRFIHCCCSGDRAALQARLMQDWFADTVIDYPVCPPRKSSLLVICLGVSRCRSVAPMQSHDDSLCHADRSLSLC